MVPRSIPTAAPLAAIVFDFERLDSEKVKKLESGSLDVDFSQIVFSKSGDVYKYGKKQKIGTQDHYLKKLKDLILIKVIILYQRIGKIRLEKVKNFHQIIML